MQRSEDTLEKIRDFLKGRMSSSEEAEFIRRIQEDPELEDQVAFAKLMMKGLTTQPSSQPKTRSIALATGVIILLAAIALAYLFMDPPADPDDGSGLPVDSIRVNAHTRIENETTVIQGGGSSNEVSDRANAIAWNSRNEILICGQFQGPSYFGEYVLPGFGNKDIFLAAISLDAKYKWVRQFGSKSGFSTSNALTIDSGDNILMTGRMPDHSFFGEKPFRTKGMDNRGNADFFITKLSPVGELIWLNHYGGHAIPDEQTGNNMGRAVAVDGNDNVIAVGDYIGTPRIGNKTLPAGGPNEDMYIIKYSPAGTVMWVESATCEYMMAPYDIAVDDLGSIYITGFFGHHNLGGTAFFGKKAIKSFGGRDIFLAKYAPDGELTWVKQAGSAREGGNDYSLDIALDKKGNCLLTGWFEGEAKFDDQTLVSSGKREMFIAKFLQDGTVSWAISAGGKADDQGSTVILDEQENVYCAGYFTGKAVFGQHEIESLGEEDAFVAKCDRNGNFRWIRQMGGETKLWNTDRATELAINQLGQLVVTGSFSGNMQIGNTTLTSMGREDIFVIFFDKDGNLIKTRQMQFQL